MKKIVLIGIFLIISSVCGAQSFVTEYSRGTTSNFCGEESFQFILGTETITRIDKFDGSRVEIVSKKESGGFDNQGFYSESWGSKFYLDKYGINEFNRIKQFTYRVVYDKRGGELLYILEIENKKGLDAGKIYLSRKGFELICK
ncbi:hypothetical protein [Algoriphagus algorifonticola]|uniref:hypothetical protein n=1 Tax=Algoriphagus algorifonticola TaxID=2593007 RepID=UPI0011A385C1|nr:hypothetical protein [Algoriphagus algorifonticola]